MKTTIGTLMDMLTYCRPHLSPTEGTFIARYVETIPHIERIDGNNYTIAIGTSPILWSCHLDTVHRTDGRQTLHVDAHGTIGLSKRSKRTSTCLGADDTAGVFVLREMIARGISGRYMFHRGEERGGIGSSHLARTWPTLIDYRAAIALDRRGTSDVITHQMCSRCASPSFATSLSKELARASGDVLKYAAAQGSYTDTAEYTDVIGECSNLSIGYAREHSPDETLNSSHVLTLLSALCELDTDRLTFKREPGEDVSRKYNIRHSWDSRLDYGDYWHNDREPARLLDLGSSVCQYCGRLYDCGQSYADESDLYCSWICEMDDERERKTYLNPELHDVLRSLKIH